MYAKSIIFSVVIPVYNSEQTLVELIDRLEQVFKDIEQPYEIILVDDNSYDNSWDVLNSLHNTISNLKIIRLARNFGQHNATLCGFNHASGDYIITLDDDLQHPPEEIPKLINKINEGFNVVYGKYEPKNSNIIENIMSKIFQKVIHKILALPDTTFLSSFGIYNRSLIENMVKIRSSHPFIFGLVAQSTSWVKIGNVVVIHHDRKRGKSNYGIVKYIKYSLNLIINYSSLPLLIISYIGIIFSIISILYGFSIIIYKIIEPTYGLMGWNSLMVAVTFLGGLLLLSMGIIGEYLRRILIETSYGQQYVINEMEL